MWHAKPGAPILGPGAHADLRYYLTLEYKHAYATVNSLWAAARQHAYIPDHIILLTPDPEGGQAKSLVAMLGAVQRSFEKEPNVTLEAIDPENLAATRKLVKGILKARRMESNEIAVDVTPGRTIPKLAIFQACVQEKPNHVFYLSVDDYDYRDAPYTLIPRRLQRSHDIIAQVVNDG